MTSTVVLTETYLRRITPTAHEAVAIVLSLLQQLPDCPAERTTGEHAARTLSPSDISIASDGTVSCRNAPRALTPADIATLLHQILDDTPGVPPGLLYSIARALRLVEAPPFESMDAFVRVLMRFERGDRRDVLAALAARAEGSNDGDDIPHGRRNRRAMPSLVTQLRHELRAIDRRRYEEQELSATTVQVHVLKGLMRDDVAGQPPWGRRRPSRRIAGRIAAVAACSGLALIAVGDGPLLSLPSVAIPPLDVQNAPSYTAETATARLVAEVRPELATRPALTPLGNSVPADGRTLRAAVRASGSVRSGRRAAPPARKSSKLRSALTFHWLRHLITVRNDL